MFFWNASNPLDKSAYVLLLHDFGYDLTKIESEPFLQ